MAIRHRFLPIPEEVNQPACKYYVSIERPECGDPAHWKVEVIKDDEVRSSMELCNNHQREHRRKSRAEKNVSMARQRVSSKGK